MARSTIRATALDRETPSDCGPRPPPPTAPWGVPQRLQQPRGAGPQPGGGPHHRHDVPRLEAQQNVVAQGGLGEGLGAGASAAPLRVGGWQAGWEEKVLAGCWKGGRGVPANWLLGSEILSIKKTPNFS